MYNIYLVSIVNPIQDLKTLEELGSFAQYRFRLSEKNGVYTFVPLTLVSNNRVEEAFNKLINLFKSNNGTTLKEDMDKGVVEAMNFADYVKFELVRDLDPSKVLDSLKLERTQILRNLEQQDKAVNLFEINGIQTWLDKATRVGLVNSLTIEKEMGRTQSTIWFGDTELILNIDKAIKLLYQIESYALECFKVTSSHKRTINSFTSIEDLRKYDFTKNYPSKLIFTIN